MTIKSEDFSRFYKAKQIVAVCSTCGQNEWTIITPPDGQQFMVHSQPIGGGLMVGGNVNIPLVLMACNSCFTVRMHAELPIQQWLAENKEAE